MKNITKITVRKEGDVNQMWGFEYDDGSVDGYYAIEGSAQNEMNDERVWEYDPKLALLLDMLLNATPHPRKWNWCIDIELNCHMKITDVKHQSPED